jgi:hypothetical protein
MEDRQMKIYINNYKSFCIYGIVDNGGYLNCLKNDSSVGLCVFCFSETALACAAADVGSTPCRALGSGAQSGVSKSRKRGLKDAC